MEVGAGVAESVRRRADNPIARLRVVPLEPTAIRRRGDPARRHPKTRARAEVVRGPEPQPRATKREFRALVRARCRSTIARPTLARRPRDGDL